MDIYMLKDTGRLFLIYRALVAGKYSDVLEREDGVLMVDPTLQFVDKFKMFYIGEL